MIYLLVMVLTLVVFVAVGYFYQKKFNAMTPEERQEFFKSMFGMK